MAKIPHGRYTKEFREEAARLVLEGVFPPQKRPNGSHYRKVLLRPGCGWLRVASSAISAGIGAL